MNRKFKRNTYGALMQEFRTFQSGDVWGDTMHWWFTCADELFRREGWTPEHWKFRASPLGPSNDPDDYATNVCVEVGADDLERFGNTLFRYAQRLKRAGLDY